MRLAPDLYPAEAAAGGLAPVVRERLGSAYRVSGEGETHAAVEHRDGTAAGESFEGRHWACAIEVAALERAFFVRLSPTDDFVAFVSGWIPELEDACRIATAVLEAADVRAVVEAEPLVQWTYSGAAFASGDEAEWHWQDLLASDAGAEFAALVRAAAEEPKLRRMQPSNSMGSLGFMDPPRNERSDNPWIKPLSVPGGVVYEVSAYAQQPRAARRRFDDPTAAAAFAAEALSRPR
ncbi:DUF6193 family natural product biosynthesis protein [Solirubrobacter taibaiensis]|nr:DUF6193 family natural product biosynthesis protein [Solirubrobacter taibaiensis]